MSSRSVSVTLSANVGGFVNAMRTAAGAVDQVGSKMKSGMAGMAQSATTNREAWETVGSTLTRIGAVAAVGVGVAVKAFADFDQAMSNVAATGDDARSNLDALRETAIQVDADTAFSAREAAGGMEELLKAGVSAQDVMGGGLKGALDLAAAGTIGVGEAAEIAATAMTQFGLSGADGPHIADLLAAGAGKAQGSVKDMGQALQQSGLVASQFGLSIEETVGTLSAFASAGLVGSNAGTSFKTMLLALANPSKESAGLMKELGINAYDAAGNFVGISDLAGQLQTKLGGLTQAQRDQALAQIFGNDAVRAANVLMDRGAAGIDSWINKVNDAGYAAETAAQKQNNLRGDLEKLTGSFESLFLQSGKGANDFLRNIVQGAEGAVDALGKLPAPIQQGALAMTGLVAAVGLGGGAFLKAVPAMVEFRSATATLAKDMPRTAAAMSTIGKAAGGLTIGIAAIAAGMAIYTQSLETANVTSGSLANAFTAMNSTVGTVGGGVEKLNEQFSQLGRSSITGLNLSFVTGDLEGLGNAMQRASNPEFGNGRRSLHWMELMVRFEGPIVGELDAVFVTDWVSETDELLPLQTHPAYPALDSAVGVSTLSATTNSTPRPSAIESSDGVQSSPIGEGLGVPVEQVDAQVIPSGPSFENDNTLKLFVMLIQNARRRVSVTSPYFVPGTHVRPMTSVTGVNSGSCHVPSSTSGRGRYIRTRMFQFSGVGIALGVPSG